MKDLILKEIYSDPDKEIFIKEVQNAFQVSFEKEFGKYDKVILPSVDIQESFNAKGAHIYFAEIDGVRVGGIVVVIDSKTNCNSLDLLYVNSDFQNPGVGYKIWERIEKLFPKTSNWVTHTPYFDKRNIHFYINRCGFKVVEFFNPKHKDPHLKGETPGNMPIE